MVNPDAYDEKYAKWNIMDLSIIPKEYKYEVAKAYRLIVGKLHVRVGYSLIENSTKIVAEVDGFKFRITSKVMKNEVFKRI